jgi:hypothetical protein
LFLDEFPEFGTCVLEVMCQPMEDKVVTISLAKGSLTFSANFQLIADMNPCNELAGALLALFLFAKKPSNCFLKTLGALTQGVIPTIVV